MALGQTRGYRLHPGERKCGEEKREKTRNKSRYIIKNTHKNNNLVIVYTAYTKKSFERNVYPEKCYNMPDSYFHLD